MEENYYTLRELKKEDEDRLAKEDDLYFKKWLEEKEEKM